MTAFYNENDPKAAATLRELIKAGLIAPGVVDERSIEDVTPADLMGFTQCHFFAGFGIWSLAFRLAGWPDDRPVWSGSCPCQPFSTAGKGDGFADERHLWPAWDWLVGECQPAEIFGEQVASSDAAPWLDLVLSDLEGKGYAGWAVDFCSAGVGAPNIRQRLIWHARMVDAGRDGWGAGRGDHRGHVGSELDAAGSARRLADADATGAARQRRNGRQGAPEGGLRARSSDGGGSGGVADADGYGSHQGAGEQRGSASSRRKDRNHADRRGVDGGLGLAPGAGLQGLAHGRSDVRGPGGAPAQRADSEPAGRMEGAVRGRPGPVNGFWRAADWLYCRDGSWRPVEPGTFPLATGYPERVGLLRGAGNAINAQVAAQVIRATMGASQ